MELIREWVENAGDLATLIHVLSYVLVGTSLYGLSKVYKSVFAEKALEGLALELYNFLVGEDTQYYSPTHLKSGEILYPYRGKEFYLYNSRGRDSSISHLLTRGEKKVLIRKSREIAAGLQVDRAIQEKASLSLKVRDALKKGEKDV